jgi:hypothetical protein
VLACLLPLWVAVKLLTLYRARSVTGLFKRRGKLAPCLVLGFFERVGGKLTVGATKSMCALNLVAICTAGVSSITRWGW